MQRLINAIFLVYKPLLILGLSTLISRKLHSKYVSRNSQKIFLNITKNFLSISKILEVSLIFVVKMHRFESFWPKILKFLAVAGVEKQDSGASMFPPSAIFEIFSSNVFGDMECIFPVGNR